MDVDALEILARAVENTVGAGVAPRPGQLNMTADVARTLEHRTHLVGIGPTGVGKTYALLSAAAWRANEFAERTLISTESLSLQTQVLSKDAPVICQAVTDLGGRDCLVAVLKGTNNYVDAGKLTRLAGLFTSSETGSWFDLATRVRATSAATILEHVDGVDPDQLRELIAWGLEQYADPAAAGDRHSYDAPHSDAEWALVSATTQEAARGDDRFVTKASLARQAAGEADIVVTNHTMLAIQAATGIPVVMDNQTLGSFDHIIVDEAHALPDEVRAQGESEVSGRVIQSALRAVSRVAAETGSLRSWLTDGEQLADLLDGHLRKLLGTDTTKRLDQNDLPIYGIGDTIAEWAGRAGRFLAPGLKSSDPTVATKAGRASDLLDKLRDSIDSVSTHRNGEARWIQLGHAAEGRRAWASAESSPVDVSGRLAFNLWKSKQSDKDKADGLPLTPLGVIAVSATLPPGFAYQAGLDAQTREYESPFTAAYANSLLFIPQATPTDLAALTSNRYGSAKFDTKLHQSWAAELVSDLVAVNEGSALVLAATAENGRAYADALRRAHPHLTVHSQWDGDTPARLARIWREDVGSVLVGTRSLMTGVDAPGETCTLVILDRVPRRPSNPRDDARVEVLTEVTGDKWDADRLVYAGDAALLEEQAVGRLIRSTSDSGMVAVLDPRLLKAVDGKRGPITYPEATRKVYMKPLYKFPAKTASRDAALDWLRNRRHQTIAA